MNSTTLFKYLNKKPLELQKLQDDTSLSKTEQAQVCTSIGYIKYFKNDMESAISYFEKAHNIYMELKDDNKIAFCLAYLALFNYLKDKSRLIKTHTLLNDALYSITNDDSAEANDIKATVFLCNGIVNYHEGNYSQALNYYKQAQSMTVADSLIYARVLDNMGIFYHNTN